MALKRKSDTRIAQEEVINQDERTCLEEVASSQRLALATRIVSERFGLDSEYAVTKFNDKERVVEITLANPDFIVAVTIKNSVAHGMYTEQ